MTCADMLGRVAALANPRAGCTCAERTTSSLGGRMSETTTTRSPACTPPNPQKPSQGTLKGSFRVFRLVIIMVSGFHPGTFCGLAKWVA